MRDMNLIRSLVRSFHFTTGLPFEDLFSEAVYAFLSNKKHYQKEKNCKFSSYIYRGMKNALIEFSRREQTYAELPDECTSVSYTPEYEFFPTVYPEDVQQIIDIIMSASGEFASVMPKMARGRVFRKLREHGYSHGKCWKMIKNMKKFINENQNLSIII
jgi:DNA-directed RNA polymerase specialized sigma24 family protein